MRKTKILLSIFTLLTITVNMHAINKRALTNREEARLYVDMLGEAMALPDKTDYSKDFYFQNYMASLQARDEMPWGRMVPTIEFRHFVLPVRVNNENLDTARIAFFHELKDRVKDLSMKEAILEVNHWCHEKVSYRPSDARTSSPLATVKTAYGRCGEESTFLVAALRSVCIPARQVYTPRWAHTDDNHAWVEAWADGEWHFLGACEPEPVLDLGWFNEGASRAMLMHTKVAGDYDGPEEELSRTPSYTEINVTSNYAPTSTVTIHVVDKDGRPVSGANVEFKIYNYAEFYTANTRLTDSCGNASLTAGRGDLLVWVTKDELVTMKKVSWRQTHIETIELCNTSLPKHLDIEIVPPAASAVIPIVSDRQRALNDQRKAQEDSIRHAYEATMPVESWRGNHRTIQQFLNEAPNKVMAEKILEVISAKDLRDINLDVLKDNEVAITDTTEIYCRYVLNPRVENEWLTPYKTFFRKEFRTKFRNIDELINWTRENITINNEENPQHLRQQPMSVYSNRRTDELGRAIFIVSAARSLGWPARINEVTGNLEYYDVNTWHEVTFDADNHSKNPNKGTLMLNFTPTNERSDLAYYTHFTISKINEGKAQLLNYPEDATWCNTFKNGIFLETGTYMLTTGNRQSNGSVLATTTLFTINANEIANVPLVLREKDELVTKIGQLFNFYYTASGGRRHLREGDSYHIVGCIAPGNEPTTHALHDIATCASQLQEMNCDIVLLSHSPEEAESFNKEEFSDLPSWVIWGSDMDITVDKGTPIYDAILCAMSQELHVDMLTKPIFVVTDSKGQIIFGHQGYTIHLGEQMLEAIKRHKYTAKRTK